MCAVHRKMTAELRPESDFGMSSSRCTPWWAIPLFFPERFIALHFALGAGSACGQVAGDGLEGGTGAVKYNSDEG